MAEQGLWNIGGFNLPDFGISEKLGIGPANAAFTPSYGKLDSSNNTYTNYQNPNTGMSQQGVYSVTGATPPKSINTNNMPQVQGSPSRYQQLTAPGYDLNPAERGELDRLIEEMKKGQQDDSRLIDEAYNDSFSYLDQAENQLKSNLPGYLESAESNYNLNKQELDNSFNSVNSKFDFTGEKNAYSKEQADAASRRLYDELRRGAQQRFGGSTSAGQAASEILGVEQQRQMGNTQQTYTQMAQEIEMKRRDVEAEYSLNTQKLLQSKQQAIADVNREFQNKMLEIAGKKGELSQAKASAKLSALQDLRNKIHQINVQNMQYEQTLSAQRQAAQLQLSSYASSANNASSSLDSQFQNVLASAGYNPSTSTSINPLTAGQGTNPLTGAISVKKPDYSKYPQDGFTR